MQLRMRTRHLFVLVTLSCVVWALSAVLASGPPFLAGGISQVASKLPGLASATSDRTESLEQRRWAGWPLAPDPPHPAGIMAPEGGLSPVSRIWREARLKQEEKRRLEEIATYARRYGIGLKLSGQIYRAAQREKVSPALAFGLVRVESGFDPLAVGPTGSIGLTQIQPATARLLSPRHSAADLYSTRLNLSLGFRYLRGLLLRFDHDVTLALSAYNRGPAHIEQLVASGQEPNTRFARKVLRNVERGRSREL
jgi:soluble lytic murein transglycosylase-like protein